MRFYQIKKPKIAEQTDWKQAIKDLIGINDRGFSRSDDTKVKSSSAQQSVDSILKSLVSKLSSGIETGIVNPKLASLRAQLSQKQQKQATQAKDIGNMNNYLRTMAQQLRAETDNDKKRMLAREVVAFMADRKGYPEWNNAIKSAVEIVKRSGMDKQGIAASIEKLKKGQQPTPLSENYQQMSLILEAMIDEANSVSGSDFVRNLVSSYTSSISDAADKQEIEGALNRIDQSLSADAGKVGKNTLEVLRSLSRMLYALSVLPKKNSKISSKKTNKQKPRVRLDPKTGEYKPSEEDFYLGKQKLDPSNPNDREIINLIRQRKSS